MNNNLSVEDIVQFIENCEPKFEYSNNREKFGMFTVTTQHVYADTVEDLLVLGVETYKKYGSESPLFRFIKSIE